MTTLEKVARAIFEAWPHQTVGVIRWKWEDIGPNDREATWYPLARAAIKALMEPSEEMVLAGHKYVFNAPFNPTKLQLLEAYYAMLTKALEE